jgi:hypothetical protein
MNKYNLPVLEQIVEQWAANVSPSKAFSEAVVYLGAKSPKEIMVDTVKIVFPRKPDLEGL